MAVAFKRSNKSSSWKKGLPCLMYNRVASPKVDTHDASHDLLEPQRDKIRVTRTLLGKVQTMPTSAHFQCNH